MPSAVMPTFRVAAVPLVSCRGDAARNVVRVADALAQAARQRIGLAVFPETCLSGYDSLAKLTRQQLDALAEPLDGPSLRAVAEAVERSGVAAGVGLIERAPDGRLFNSYVVCVPGGLRYGHRKLHTFEHRRIASGERFTVFETSWGVRIGILIGADNYLVENMRTTALMGATLLIAPHRTYGVTREGVRLLQPLSSEPWLQGDGGAGHNKADRRTGSEGGALDGLRRRLPARAADNGMFVVFSDGAGDGAGTADAGAGIIIDPCGRVLADCASGDGSSDTMAAADLDTALIRGSAGQQWLGARRPDLYGPLSQSARQPAQPFQSRGVSSRGSIALSFASVPRDRLTPG